MSAEIRAATGVTPELSGGGGGIFDVAVDGALVFSKNQENRFPNPGEIAALLKDMNTL